MVAKWLVNESGIETRNVKLYQVVMKHGPWKSGTGVALQGQSGV